MLSLGAGMVGERYSSILCAYFIAVLSHDLTHKERPSQAQPFLLFLFTILFTICANNTGLLPEANLPSPEQRIQRTWYLSVRQSNEVRSEG